MLERLRGGIFGTGSLRSDGSEFHALLKKYSTPLGASGEIAVGREILNAITTQQLNLLKGSFSFIGGQVDLIFFRNTLLYVALEKRPLLLERLAGMLAPGGYMFLASSEVPFVELPDMEPVESGGVYFFRKRVSGTIPAHPAASAVPVRQTVSAVSSAHPSGECVAGEAELLKQL